MSKVFIGYTTRGGDYDHAVIEGEETPSRAVCGVVVRNRSDSFEIDSPWSCKRCVKILKHDSKRRKLSIFDTDSASPVRLSFQNEGEAIFSISPDGTVTVNPDIELDDVGRAFWKAVERTAPARRVVTVNEDVEPGDLVTEDMIEVGSHGGGKTHMTEQQNKALLEKDPDYVAKLMTPANTPGKSDDSLRRAMYVTPRDRVTPYIIEDMPALVALGYRRTSRKYGIVSRIDRPDWKEVLARSGYLMGPGREGNHADTYRACYSSDKITLEPPSLALEVPTSGHDPIGFVPKDQLEQQGLDAYLAKCSECGRMRTTVEVLPVKPRPGDGRIRYVLMVNGVAVLEFENSTAQARKVYKALRTESRP